MILLPMPSDEYFTHPIDWHMRMPLTLEEHENSRRRKADEDSVANRLLQRICAARAKRIRAMREQMQISEDHRTDSDAVEKNQIMSTPPIDGSKWIGVNSDDNHQRFYIRYIWKSSAQKAPNTRSNEVRAEILNQQSKRIREEIEAVRENKIQMMTERQGRPSPPVFDLYHSADDSSLWVKKYSPRFYTDLLSDDGINRSLMSWIKLWDECVFKRKIVNLPNVGSVKERDVLTLETGKLRRPTYKIALLSGPAGLGKTTLTKVVAQQAGYATVELNASDSRNVQDFEKALEGSVHTSRTLDKQSRPNCLIFDEIDGAPVESIRYLIKAVSSTGKKAVRRPIICICNNLYTSSLRELRAVALNIQITPTSAERLIQRLTVIADAENVKINCLTLRRLVELCQCDVRLAINTLQLVSALAKKEDRYVTTDDIQKVIEREKIGSLSIFESLSTVLDFTHHFDKQNILNSLPERLRTVERVAVERGDDRFVSGLYESYVNVNLPLKSMRLGVEAFVYYDRVMLAINEKQNYVLLKYIAVFYMLLHAAVASHTRAKLKFPQQELAAMQRRRESQETLAVIQCALLGRHSSTALISDVLPLLVQIVQPSIKVMNEQLYNSRDLDQIENIINIMSDYHVTFTPAVVNSQPQYLFHPSVDVLTMFPISDSSSRNLLSNSTRQMIAHKMAVLHAAGQKPDENTDPRTNTSQIKEMITHSRVSKPVEMGRYRPLLYKYHTGSSTAVKRTIRMYQLLN
ncbi:hypothetical protein KIN20_009359 [Parelaphostrongylus tenuis]|uniref:AAA+ ATPase domain-containing protein n=1 Tax=Parelaphostrongylus tenuis TaxID=148309 RepID=A0AAD5QL74_PARTN|nr:hypothetical protein KIN20_009359 [Parelaphostrongylus tenuis]